MTLRDHIHDMGRRGHEASRRLAQLPASAKNAILLAMADGLLRDEAAILTANTKDLDAAVAKGLSSAMIDRLTLNPKRIADMAQGIREVAALTDPVGEILTEWTRPNGLRIDKVSSPIGVVVIIYESRPNVTADAASLCLKSGNACILRGGKEALNSNQMIAELMVSAARGARSQPATLARSRTGSATTLRAGGGRTGAGS